MRDTNGLGEGAERPGGDVWGTVRLLEEQLASERRAREQAEAAALAKERYLASLAQAFRNPLSSIAGWLQIIGAAKVEPSERHAAIASLTRNVRTLLSLVDDIANHARTEPVISSADFVSVELGNMLAQLVQHYRPLAQHRGVKLQASIAACTLAGDAYHLRLALDHLVQHALRFAAPGSEVLVTSRCEAEHLAIVIRDSSRRLGTKLPSNAFDHASPPGVAAGMQMARRCIELHGGVISTRVQRDAGSLLTIRLPLGRQGSASI